MANIKVLVNGAKGKMGEETVKAVQKADGLTLVGQTDLGDDLAKKIKETGAEVVVDFTVPQTVMNKYQDHPGERRSRRRRHDRHDRGLILKAVQALTEKHRVKLALIAPNFAIGPS